MLWNQKGADSGAFLFAGMARSYSRISGFASNARSYSRIGGFAGMARSYSRIGVFAGMARSYNWDYSKPFLKMTPVSAGFTVITTVAVSAPPLPSLIA